MKQIYRYLMAGALLASGLQCLPLPASAAVSDPDGAVEKWSNASTSPKIIDINFSDTSWPDTWPKDPSKPDKWTGRACPEWADDTYVNAIINVPVIGTEGVTYPVLFHNCTFATKASNGGSAAATAAFSRQFYHNESAPGRPDYGYNDWKSPGHTVMLEDNVVYENGRPVKGEAGFVQMCRGASLDKTSSLHGWMEIDHIPYVERIQWSWSSTSWGRGIKCDIKIGDGEWKPLVWAGSEKQKQGWTVFSDQGYFMENVIDRHDVSLRWRVWDGDGKANADDQVQKAPFDWQAIDPLATKQAPRVHKLQIFGDRISAEQADYAKANPVGDVGELSDLSKFGFTQEGNQKPAPDENAPVTLLYVNPDGSGDYSTIQAAINAVPDGTRGIIYIAPGIYDENIYAGTKENHNKFISLIGADAATTILTSSVNRGGSSGNSYTDCAALNVFTERFYAENLTIRNTSGNVGQAEALYTAADAHLFKNCILEGFQDTYKANTGARGYFTGCKISGSTDFIYDGGLEWFEGCDIICLYNPNGGYITAPAEAGLTLNRTFYPELSAQAFRAGLFFNSCNIMAGEGTGASTYYLGRPWKVNSGSMFLNCRLGNHIKAEGWKDWNGSENSASLYEYKNLNADGSPADISRRAAFSSQASDAEVAAYISPEFLFKKASEIPFDFKAILSGTAEPCNFTVSPSSFSWESGEDAAGYIIYRNGKMECLSVETSYTLPAGAEASEFSVASISRHGVTTKAVSASEAARLMAFPTAEGFGKYATGGRGGKVVKVTSTADDGTAGTLRWAFDQHKGEPLTIIFEVSGDIALASPLNVKRANWTLAGQTAPGEGIVITRNKLNVGGSQNFIVRNMRFRIGQKDMSGQIIANNALGAENCSNFIFDHCSFGWSTEENMNTADSHFLTVQYSMLHEGLYNAGHVKDERGYACQWGGSPATYHHNLLAHNNSRSPRFNGARGEDHVVFMEYVNNVNYNYGKRGGCYGGENTAPVSNYTGLNSVHECNFINNYYKPGPWSDKTRIEFVNSSYARSGATSWGPAKWYINGNIAEGFPSANADNWTAIAVEGSYTLADIRADRRIVTATPWYQHSALGPTGRYIPENYMLYDIQSAEEAFKTVVKKAGTINRDKVERRVADDVKNGKVTFSGDFAGAGMGMIDTEADAEGFFPYRSDYTVPADTDGDGMPDEWEKANNLDPTTPDNNLVNAEGYTALEVWLNSLMGELSDNDFRESSIGNICVDNRIDYDSASRSLRVGETSIGALLEVYGIDGRRIAMQTISSAETSLAHLPEGILLLRVSSRSITPVTLKIKL
ncbi:pectinesterase family protein [Duncaniella muris]|uniref:pectinesterase family protein n=1 Tax=Duncaniella muris TaxID=2094150 RepID=UPI0027153FC3|nr:pectinesterase family protein [Duncaniella muris]